MYLNTVSGKEREKLNKARIKAISIKPNIGFITDGQVVNMALDFYIKYGGLKWEKKKIK